MDHLSSTGKTVKSTVDEIRRRFDADVDRFSNLETGQSATVDAPLAMSLVAEAAAVTTPQARQVLDVGCGAGNYTLRLLERLPNLDVTLVDLSRPMLERAAQRVRQATTGAITALQADVRELAFSDLTFDIILAAAVLHHLREESEWREVFATFHRCLKPGGSVWIFDLVQSSIPAVERLMRRKYGGYLTEFKDETYRDQVFAYVEKEDTPRPLMFQLDLLRQVGFDQVEVLHKNVCFAAYGGGEALSDVRAPVRRLAFSGQRRYTKMLKARSAVFATVAALSLMPAAGQSPEAAVEGTPKVWHPITLTFHGPVAHAADDKPNPFLDYRLQVRFTGPNGREFDVPGFFDGDGKQGASGACWRVRFAADRPGEWHFQALFRTGPSVAVSLAADAGMPASFDGVTGKFTVGERDPAAPGFLRWGRLSSTGQLLPEVPGWPILDQRGDRRARKPAGL